MRTPRIIWILLAALLLAGCGQTTSGQTMSLDGEKPPSTAVVETTTSGPVANTEQTDLVIATPPPATVEPPTNEPVPTRTVDPTATLTPVPTAIPQEVEGFQLPQEMKNCAAVASVDGLENATRRNYAWIAFDQGGNVRLVTDLVTYEKAKYVRLTRVADSKVNLYKCRSTAWEDDLAKALFEMVPTDFNRWWATTRSVGFGQGITLIDTEKMTLVISGLTQEGETLTFKYKVNGTESSMQQPVSFNPATPISVDGSGGNTYQVLLIEMNGEKGVRLLILSTEPAHISGGSK
ncbi:hypothetical protein HGA91_04145 [candidate division WWE3 bacterium]|nr:hypothetical protein [candidate division WWE3 bacterium]